MQDKIVFSLPSNKTGGGNRVIIELANLLSSKGISVDIVYPYNSLEINTFTYSDKINFIRIGEYKSSNLNKLINLLLTFSFLSKNYSNAIIIFTDPIMSIFTLLIRTNRIYRFVQADDYRIYDDLMILKNKLFLFLYKLLTKISYNYKINFIFNSRYSYDKFLEISKRKDIVLKLVHPAVNKKVFYDRNIRKNNEVNICIVARKHPWKGFIDFINPFNENKIHGVSCVYVISNDDLSDFNLSKVTLIKPKDDVEIAYYLNISHIFVSTSWWEGFGLPALEAMACGCAVLLTNAGGVNEYAVPNINCLMYEPKCRNDLVEKLNLLIKNEELRARLSKNAVQIVEKFSWEKSVNQLLDILNEST